MEVHDKMNTTIRIATDFSRFPAGRFLSDGHASGQAFREKILAKALLQPGIQRVTVDFDGVAGFGSSFLEEAFGGLVRADNFQKSFLDAHLLIRTEEPELKDYVKLALRYIKDAARAGKKS